jgi:hypothetical protein
MADFAAVLIVPAAGFTLPAREDEHKAIAEGIRAVGIDRILETKRVLPVLPAERVVIHQ